jgi:hypothetical protein
MATASPLAVEEPGRRPEDYGEVLATLPQTVEVDHVGYQVMVDRTRKVVEGTVAPGSAVLVVSRGDDELVDLRGRRGWHFPRDEDGGYAGHYPSDSGVAISQLEALRTKGAEYIVFPATAYWWFQHYPELAHHLKTRYPTVVQIEDTCLVFALWQATAWGLTGLLDTVLPADATVIVVSSGDSSLLRLEGRQVWHFPHTNTGAFDHSCSGEKALERLEGTIERGAQYLVLPSVSPSWLEDNPDFVEEVERRYREVLRREHPCTVFDLTRPASE